MGLSGKHTFGSIGETRVTFVEKGVDEDRRDFLKKLLEHNGFEVIIDEEKRKTEERKLKTFNGHKVTQDYWNQKTTDANPHYWNNGKKS